MSCSRAFNNFCSSTVSGLFEDFRNDELFENSIKQRFYKNFEIELDLKEFNSPVPNMIFNNFVEDDDENLNLEKFDVFYSLT